MLAFWSTLNVSSDKEEPGVKELAEEYDNDEATFAAVYVNGAPEDYQAPYFLLRDTNGKLTSRYNVKRVPRLFLIKNGIVELVLNGYYDGSEEDLKDALKKAVEDG